MKRREEIVNEMLVQVQGVFRHYTDHTLNAQQSNDIRVALDRIVPQEYTCENWQAYSRSYQARVEAESNSEDDT